MVIDVFYVCVFQLISVSWGLIACFVTATSVMRANHAPPAEVELR